MSVLIKGMEMPNTCKACVCSSYYDRMDMILCDITNKQLDEKQWKSERHPDCPLIEVPTPHGRLGDLDALKAQYKYGEADSEDEKVWMMNIRRAIANAPTVIKAED